MNVVKVLQKLRPGAQWNLRGDAYEGLEWLDEQQTKPLLQEVKNEWVNMDKALQAKNELPSMESRVNALLLGGLYLSALNNQIDTTIAKYDVTREDVL